MKALSLNELRASRAVAQQRAEKAAAQADELLFQSESLSTAASRMVEQSFTAQSMAQKYESEGNEGESARQRAFHAEILSSARENYDKADAKGHLATECQRTAFRQEHIARDLRDQIKALMSQRRNGHGSMRPHSENGDS